MNVSDFSIQAEEAGIFFKILGRSSAKAGKKLSNTFFKTPVRALDITLNVATAAATIKSRNVNQHYQR